MTRVTVYASSSEKIDPEYHRIAEQLGEEIAKRGWELVFGGGRFGLMGSVSRAARAGGAAVTGVILQDFVDKNVHCTDTEEMTSVGDMRSRKQGLDEAGDAYIALPGGFGTFEELFEILSFKQLGFHRKPVVVLNARGYYDPLLSQIVRGFEQGFIQPTFPGMFEVADDAITAIQHVENALRSS